MYEASYASTADVIDRSLDGLLPAKRVSVDDYALAHRWLANAGGGYVGRWRHEMAPYLVEPMACLTSLDYLTVAIVGPGQSGKTSIAENWLLYSSGSDPADVLWFMQTDDGLESYIKSRINPMIDAHPELRDNLGLRPVDDSLHFKRFKSMRAEFLSATLNNLINKSAPRIVADEIDAYPKSIGDVKALLDVRRQTFGRQSKLLAMSHPDMAKGIIPERDWSAGIMAIYADSTRCVWYWPCPDCGGWSSPVPIADRVMILDYPQDGTLDEIEANARLICPICGVAIEDKHRRAMNAAALNTPFRGYIGDGQSLTAEGKFSGERVRRTTAGFWFVGAMSPFILGGIGGLARARVKAEREREVSGEDDTLRQVMVKQWGVPYTPPRVVGSVDANDLADRSEDSLKLGFVPDGARFITIAVDCQVAHFEFLTRAWGVKGESWIIDKGRIAADPATSAKDWDGLLELAAKVYPLADGTNRAMKVRAVSIDSAGAPGVTQQAYTAWTRWRAARKVRMYGKTGGREMWSIILLKGASGRNAPKLQVTYPDTSRKSNVAAGAGTVPVGLFNPNLFKDDLMGQLQCAAPGDWFVHYPRELRSKEAPHLFFEQIVSETRQKNGTWEKINSSARNEALDLHVMTHVAAHLHGLTRINWSKPPSWADAFDANALVVVTEPDVVPRGVAPDALPATSPGSVAPETTPGVRIVTEGPAKKSLFDRLA